MLGSRLGILLKGGECVLLTGELGAGKTAFIRGLARGLGVDDAGAVHSPSYMLVNHYTGPVPLTHIDAYFMRFDEDLELCGFEDAIARRDVVAVEWADRLDSLVFSMTAGPTGVISVRLEHVAENERKISFENWPVAGGGGSL